MRFVFNVYTIYKFKAAGVEENCLGYTGENLAIIFSSCCAIPEFGENAPICAEREHREHIAHSDPIQLPKQPKKEWESKQKECRKDDMRARLGIHIECYNIKCRRIQNRANANARI